MNVRPGVPLVVAPNKSFTSTTYSELVASKLPFTVEGRKVVVTVPLNLPTEDRAKITNLLKELGFDGLDHYSTEMNMDRNAITITVVVSEVV